MASRDDQVNGARRGAAAGVERFERGKRVLVLAAVCIAGGLAVAGTRDRTVGGAAVLAGWLLAVAALHLLGRAGADRAR